MERALERQRGRAEERGESNWNVEGEKERRNEARERE